MCRYYPYVQNKEKYRIDGGRPSEHLPLLPRHVSFEAAATKLVEHCVEPAGLVVERVARVPYLCLGDTLGASMYELDDCVLVCRALREGEQQRHNLQLDDQGGGAAAAAATGGRGGGSPSPERQRAYSSVNTKMMIKRPAAAAL